MFNSNIIKLKVSDYPIQNGRIDKWIIEALSLLNSSYPEDLKVNTFFSRTKVKDLILSGNISIDGMINKNPSYKIDPNNIIVINLPKIKDYDLKAENIPINIVFEDEHLLVINKEPNFVVHPSPGHNSGTLVNAILYHCDGKLSGIGGIKRPGIVHRIDKDTSGLIVVAKNNKTHENLSSQFNEHTITRVYQLLIWGKIRPSKGKIETYITRSSKNRQMMEAFMTKGKWAITNYQTLEVFENDSTPTLSLIECKLETGRTHQIRVHMNYLGNSILGDTKYKKKYKKIKNINEQLNKLITGLNRQFLHAKTLGFIHPKNGKELIFSSVLPPELEIILKTLRNTEK